MNTNKGGLCEFTCPETISGEELCELLAGWTISSTYVTSHHLGNGMDRHNLRLYRTNEREVTHVFKTASSLMGKDRKNEISRITMEVLPTSMELEETISKSQEVIKYTAESVTRSGFFSTITDGLTGGWQYTKLLDKIKKGEQPSFKDIEIVCREFEKYWGVDKWMSDILSGLNDFLKVYSDLIEKEHKFGFYFAWFGMYILSLPAKDVAEMRDTTITLLSAFVAESSLYGALIGFLDGSRESRRFYVDLTKKLKLSRDVDVERFILFMLEFAPLQFLYDKEILWTSFVNNSKKDTPFGKMIGIWYGNCDNFGNVGLRQTLLNVVVDTYAAGSGITPEEFLIAHRHSEGKCFQACSIKIAKFNSNLEAWIDAFEQINVKHSFGILTMFFNDALDKKDPLKLQTILKYSKKHPELLEQFHKDLKKSMNESASWTPEIILDFHTLLSSSDIYRYIREYRLWTLFEFSRFINSLLLLEISKDFNIRLLLQAILGSEFFKNKPEMLFSLPFKMPSLTHAYKGTKEENDLLVEVIKSYWDKFKYKERDILIICADNEKESEDLPHLYTDLCESYCAQKFAAPRASPYNKVTEICEELYVKIIDGKYSFMQAKLFINALIFMKSDFEKLLTNPIFGYADKTMRIFYTYGKKVQGKSMELEFTNTFKKNFTSLYLDFLQRLENNEEKRGVLLSCLDKSGYLHTSLNLLIEVISPGYPFEELVKSKLAIFKQIELEINKSYGVIEWLVDRKLVDGLKKHGSILLNDKTIVEAVEEAEIFKTRIEGLAESHVEAIDHFGKKSTLFNEITAFYINEGKNGEEMKLKDIIEKVVSFLENIFCQKSLTLKELENVAQGVIKSLKKSNTKISDEATLVSEYFKKVGSSNQGQGGPVDFDVGLLESALKIMEYSRSVNSLVNCFVKFKMENKLNDNIKDLATTLTSTEILISDVKPRLEECRKVLANLENYHLRFFEKIPASSEIIDFFIKFKDFDEFEKKLDVVTSGLQKNNYEMTLVSNLKVTFRLLTPFFEKKSKDLTFTQIAQHFVKEIENEGMCKNLFDAIENVQTKLAEVALWFSRIGGITGVKLLKKGNFVSNLSRHHDGESIELKYKMDQTRVLQQDDLNDLVSNIVVELNSPELDLQDEKSIAAANDMREFKECVDIALECHKIILDLESNGFHELSKSKIEITVKEITKVHCLERLEFWKKTNMDWNERMKRLDDITELLHLSSIQLVAFTNLLKQNVTPQIIKKLIPYCFTLFYDESEHLPSGVNPEFVENALAAIQEIQDESERIKTFIKVIRDKFGRVNKPKFEAGPREVIKCFDRNQQGDIDFKTHLSPILKTFEPQLYEFDGGFIMNTGQILFASPLTTKGDLRRFYKRREAFPDKVYMVLGAQTLLPSIREEMIKIESQTDEGKVPKTVYVLYGPNGQDSFSLMKETGIGEQIDQLIGEIKKNVNKWNCTVQVVYGAPGCGKSRLISQKMIDAKHSFLTISANEDFTTQHFINAFQRSLKDQKEVSIHFNISSKANFEEVQRFFFYYFFFGILIDETTGNLVVIPKSKINWLIEAPFEYSSHFFNKVPILNLFTTNITPPNQTYILDGKAKLVAKFLKYQNDLMAFGPDLKDDYTLDLLETCFQSHKIHSLVDKKAFVSIMHQKCDFYVRLKENYVLNRQLAAALKIGQEDDQVMDRDGYNYRAELLLVSCNTFQFSFLIILEEINMLIKGENLDSYHVCKESDNFHDLMCFDVVERVVLKGNDRDKDVLRRDLPGMRRHLANLLGVGSQTNVLINILMRNHYILTFDFFVKMILLHERLKMGTNVIFEGETGIGKTEMLRIFADIYNSNQNIRPEPDVIIAEAFKSFFGIALDNNHQNGRGNLEKLVAYFEKDLVSWKEQYLMESRSKSVVEVRKKTIEKHLNSPVDLLALLFKDLTANFINHKIFLQESNDNLIYWIVRILKHSQDIDDVQFAQSFVTHVCTFVQNELFGKYPLIMKNKEVEEMYKELQANPFTLHINVFVDFLRSVFKASPSNLFFKIMMHGDLSIGAVRNYIKDFIDKNKKANDLYKTKDHKIHTIVFIDELNTSSFPGFMKEIFFDRKMDGVDIPDTIFFVGAINPFSDKNDEKSKHRKYTVKEMPPCMKDLQIKFGDLSVSQQQVFLEIAFLEHYIDETRHIPSSDADAFKKTLVWCQNYIAGANEKMLLENMVPSLRDIIRFIKLYHFFGNVKIFDENWKNLYMTIAICYYFRLEKKQRSDFVTKFELAFPKVNQSLVKLVNTELLNFYKKMEKTDQIPKGIARTQALMENLFCNIVCIQSGIPLFIIGPPGTSKTLSFNIASSTTNETFDFVKKVHNTHYQCSQYSTGQEIEAVFKSQLTQMETMGKTNASDIFCVFLDEAGLPTEKRHALKVIHYYLDHPCLSSVIISNTMLDAAKTNRALLLRQPDSDDDDLKSLAEGCLFHGQEGDERHQAIMYGVINAYKTVNKMLASASVELSEKYPINLFQLRDFIYFLRMIDREGDLDSDGKFTPKNILYSLQRNFNGVSPRMFERVVAHFFKCIQDAMKTRPEYVFNIPKSPMRYQEVVSKSICDRVKEGEDPNHAPFRYVLLIDPTETQSAFDLLFTENILERDKTVVCSVSDFAQDENSYAKSQVISEFKQAMQDGKTVILVNGLSISSNLYDVFNRHFSIIKEENGSKYYANVAMGAFSRKCPVHKDFQLIVHMPLSEYVAAPDTLLPFLNRFEKYIFGFTDIWQEKMNSPMYASKKQELQSILDGVLDFVDFFKTQSFYGYVKETVYSLMIHFLSTGQAVPIIPSPLEIKNETYTPQKQTLGQDFDLKERINEMIRHVNFHLLQIAKPEAVYLQRFSFPSAYIEQYLGNQEHLTFANFCKNFFSNDNQDHKKYILYTRSSATIEYLSNKVYQDQFCEEIESEEIAYINLASIDTQLMTVEQIKQFFASGKKNLILLCNMSSVTNKQINFFKQQFDSRWTQYQVKVLFVIHFPTEYLALGKTVYNSIYLNNWEYVYIDGHQRATIKDIDSRWWFTTATGLEALNSQHLVKHIREPFNKLLDEIMERRNLAHVKEIIKERKYLMTIIADYFTETWLNRYIRDVVSEICQSVSLGTSTKSIIEMIQNVIKNKLEIIGSQFIQICLQYINHLQVCHDDTPESIVVMDLIALYLRRFPVANYDDESFSLIQREDAPLDDEMMFYYMIKDLLDRSLKWGEEIFLIQENLKDTKPAQTKDLKNNIATLRDNYMKQLEQNVEVNKIIASIEGDAKLFAKFKKSFLRHVWDEKPDFTQVKEWLFTHSPDISDHNNIFSLLYFEHIHQDWFVQLESHLVLFVEGVFQDYTHCKLPIEMIHKFYSKSIEQIQNLFLQGDQEWYSKFLKLKSIVGVKTFQNDFFDENHWEMYQDLLICSSYRLITGADPQDRQNPTIARLASEIQNASIKNRFLTMVLVETYEIIPYQVEDHIEEFFSRCNGALESLLWKTIPTSTFYGIFKHLLTSHKDIFARSIRKHVNQNQSFVTGANKLLDIVHHWISVGNQANIENPKDALKKWKEMKQEDLYDKICHQTITDRTLNLLLDKILHEPNILIGFDNQIRDLIKEFFKLNNMTMNLLSRINSENELIELLKCKDDEIIDMFGLKPFLIQDQQPMVLHEMPCIHTQEYKDLEKMFAKTPQELVAYIRDKAVNNNEIYKLRMHVFLILYHSFFAKGLKCDVLCAVMDKVANLLKLEADEVLAYTFYLKGLLVASKKDPILYWFSKTVYEANKPVEMYWSRFLVNITAACLGVPKEKNYLWTRAFNPSALHETLGPGSTHENRNWDCGYKFGDENENTLVDMFKKGISYPFTRPHILNSNTFHHAALNTLTWGAYILCMLYKPSNEVNAKGGHMLNYVEADCVSFERINQCKMSGTDQVSHAIFMKCSAFNSITGELCLQQYSTEPLLFFTYALYNYTQQVPNSDLVGIMPKGQEVHCRNYEVFVRDKTFLPFFSQLKEIKEALAKRDGILKEISQKHEVWKSSSRKICTTDSEFIECMSKFMEMNQHDPKTLAFKHFSNIHTDPNKKYDKLNDFAYIVSFYCKLLKFTQAKYTEEETRTLTFKQVVQDLSGKISDDEFHQFIDKWSKLSIEAVACDPLERIMVQIDTETTLNRLLIIDTEDTGIFKWIEAMTMFFNKCSGFMADDAVNINYAINVKHLALPMVASLVITNMDDLVLMMQSCAIDDKGQEFDWDLVYHFILQKIVNNKATIDAQKLQAEYYKFRVPPEKETPENLKNISQESVIYKISKWERQQQQNSSFVEFTGSFSWIGGIKSKDEILLLLRYVWYLIPHIKKVSETPQKCSNIFKDKSMSNLKWIKEINNNYIERINILETKHIKSLASTLINVYHMLDSQISITSSQDHTKPFTREIKQFLDKLQAKILSGDIEKNYDWCYQVSQYLMSSKFEQGLKDSKKSQKSLIEIGRYEFEKRGFFPVQEWICPDLILEMYDAYMKWMQITLGKLNHLLLTEPRDKQAQVYKEKVAKVFETTQVELNNQDPIEKRPEVVVQKMDVKEEVKNQYFEDIVDKEDETPLITSGMNPRKSKPSLLKSIAWSHTKKPESQPESRTYSPNSSPNSKVDTKPETIQETVKTTPNMSQSFYIPSPLQTSQKSPSSSFGTGEPKFVASDMTTLLKLVFGETTFGPYFKDAVGFMAKLIMNDYTKIQHLNMFKKILSEIKLGGSKISESIVFDMVYRPENFVSQKKIQGFEISMPLEDRITMFMKELETDPMKQRFIELFGGDKEYVQMRQVCANMSQEEVYFYFIQFEQMLTKLPENQVDVGQIGLNSMAFMMVYDLKGLCEALNWTIDLDFVCKIDLETRLNNIINIFVYIATGAMTAEESIECEWPEMNQ